MERSLHRGGWLYGLLFGLALNGSLFFPQPSFGQSNTSEVGPITKPIGILKMRYWRIPVNGNNTDKPIFLDATTFQPVGVGPFPLVIINHGGAVDAPSNAPWDYRPEAAIKWFVSKGFSVAIPIRRGYGRSEGARVSIGNCSSPAYIDGGKEIARDIISAVDYFRQQSFILADRIVLIGHSLGGAGSLAAASRHPEGVRGVIAFGPGAGRMRQGKICRADLLESAFREFGATNDLPTIWIYAENDKYFGPKLAQHLFRAYVQKKTPIQELEILPPSGDDGHDLFLRNDGPVIWAPIVEKFLKRILH
ncbi:alpha/beta hydrolase family protein [Phyllobacterium sp. K27]